MRNCAAIEPSEEIGMTAGCCGDLGSVATEAALVSDKAYVNAYIGISTDHPRFLRRRSASDEA
jgi:hypothetical protein